jgi:hypothetical protein
MRSVLREARVRAAARADATRADPRVRPVRHDHLRRVLEQAINAERFGGAQSTEVLSYAPNRVADLPTEREHLQRPVVYHLLGRVSASPTVRDLGRGHDGVRLRAAKRAP